MPTNEELQKEIDELRTEIKTLKDFVKALYAMINEEEEYEPSSDYKGGVEVGRFNT